MRLNDCKAVYCGSDLIYKIYHGSDLVYHMQPEIKVVGMALASRTRLKFKVASNGTNMDDVSVRVTYPDGESSTATEYSIDGGFYVFQHDVSAHRIPEAIKIELICNGTVIQTRDGWTIQGYLYAVLAQNPDNTELAELAAALLNYGEYAAYYNNPTGAAPSISAVESVTTDDLKPYKSKVNKLHYSYGATCGLYITDVCDILVKFNESAWNGHKLLIDGIEADVTIENGKVSHRITDILPRDWGKLFHIQLESSNGEIVVDIEYAVLSYAYSVAGSSQQTSLQGLLKSMYLYHVAILKAEAHMNDGFFS